MAFPIGVLLRRKELEDKTPIQLPVVAAEEFITVTDPCHPLFGHECKLVEIYYRQDGVGFCRVKVGELGSSDVPLTATDRANPKPIQDSLLSYQSVQQLLATYKAIMEARDGAVSKVEQARERARDRAPNSMAVADGQPTTGVPADIRADLSAISRSSNKENGGA